MSVWPYTVCTAYMQVAKAMSDYLGPEASVKVSLGLSSSATRDLQSSLRRQPQAGTVPEVQEVALQNMYEADACLTAEQQRYYAVVQPTNCVCHLWAIGLKQEQQGWMPGRV